MAGLQVGIFKLQLQAIILAREWFVDLISLN